MSIPDRQQAVEWLYEHYGPAGTEWDIDQLTYVTFENDKHATYFIMRFS
jgi:hypothetical protein